MRTLFIAKSRNGKGVYTNKVIAPEELIYKIEGMLLSNTLVEALDQDSALCSNTYRYSKNKYISPEGKLGAYFNHSCNPNAYICKDNNKLKIHALSTIENNEEILFDYSTILASDDSWSMICNCGMDNCRGIIQSRDGLDSVTKKTYIENKIIPQYILDIY